MFIFAMLMTRRAFSTTILDVYKRQVQEGADINLYYEDPYARANVELFFYSHYTVPLDALDVRSARKAAKRFAAGC